ncbi:OmpH family outer membrane protein [Desulfobulbus oralis]|uniref:Molecular chaperone Skp n=1 Tax=Desulfobulbus oralis TaxID=1986146 RepID=A0A2L1GQX7_9BACT|nr:OmpH family outer membrane protein [Desulfobulbus oralis]AVD72037.1 hypothetical protein CAY53_11590 [Desulfobulbus oralis]
MKGLKCIVAGLCMAVLCCFSGLSGQAGAAELKVGVVNMQKVFSSSNAGRRAQNIIEQKAKSYEASFKKDKDALRAMRDEIDKKNSAWSNEVKREKITAFQKKSAELASKEREANMEIRKLQERHVQPVLKKLEEVIQKEAKSGNYDLILPNNAILFAASQLDITDDVTRALDAAMK